MRGKKATRRSCHYGRARVSTRRSDTDIVRDYERGCKWAALMLAAMLLAMAAMEVTPW